MSETIRVQGLSGDTDFPAYVARPQDSPTAAIVVIQEIFGVNAGIRRKCDTLAEAGYLAIAPDLFHTFGEGIELDPDIPAEMDQAMTLFQKFDQDQGVRDIEAAIRWARGEGCAKVGAVGYCLGGRLAYMTAARTDSDASVGYYAVGIDNLLHEKRAIANPLLDAIRPQQRAHHELRRGRLDQQRGGARHQRLLQEGVVAGAGQQ